MNDTTKTNIERFTRRADSYRGGLTDKETSFLARVAQAVDFGPGKNLVDFGAGTGNSALPFLERGGSVVGIEITPAMARKGIARLKELGCGERILYTISAADRAPVRENSADCAICRYVFHHLDDPRAVLGEMTRCVRPGGTVVIIDFQVPDDPAERRKIDEIERTREPSHQHLLSIQDLQAMYADSGMEVTRVEEHSNRESVRSWLGRAEISEKETAWIHGEFGKMRDAGGGWLEVREEEGELIHSRKWMIIIGRKR